MNQEAYAARFAGQLYKDSKDPKLFKRSGSALNNTNTQGEGAKNSKGNESRINCTPIEFKSDINFIDDNEFRENGVIYFSDVDHIHFSKLGTGKILSVQNQRIKH